MLHSAAQGDSAGTRWGAAGRPMTRGRRPSPGGGACPILLHRGTRPCPTGGWRADQRPEVDDPGPFSSRGARRTLLHRRPDRVLWGRGSTYLDRLTPLYMFRHVSPGQPDVREQGGRGIRSAPIGGWRADRCPELEALLDPAPDSESWGSPGGRGRTDGPRSLPFSFEGGTLPSAAQGHSAGPGRGVAGRSMPGGRCPSPRGGACLILLHRGTRPCPTGGWRADQRPEVDDPGPFSSRGASRTLLHRCLDRVLRGRGSTYLDHLTPLYMFRHVSPGQPDVPKQGGRGIRSAPIGGWRADRCPELEALLPPRP